MVRRPGRAWVPTAHIALIAAVLPCVACNANDLEPDTSRTASVEQGTDRVASLNGGTKASPAPISALTLDSTASGQLVDRELKDPLPAGPPGTFGFLDPFGSISRYGSQKIEPDFDIANLESGEVYHFGNHMYVGKADRDDGQGYIGDFAMPQSDVIVWISRHEVGELALDDYDVFSWDGKAQPVKIGHSTVDVDGVSIAAPGNGNYLTVVGDSAWWVEGELSDSGSTSYSSIYSAPLDGSTPQGVAVAGARLPRADTCTTNATLSYVEDSTSSGSSPVVATLKSATVTSGAAVNEATELWRASSPNLAIDSADTCGEHWAVSYTDWAAGPDAEVHPSGVAIGGPDGEVYFELPPKSTSAGSVTVTSFGTFFFDWGGIAYGQQYFYSFATKQLYYIGDGASFGFTRVGARCAAMASETPSSPGAAAPDYTLRLACTP